MSSRKRILSLNKAHNMARRRKIERLKARVSIGSYTAPKRAVARALIMLI